MADQMAWRCDYCLTASFPTYDEASHHELTCPARLNAPNVIEDDRVPPPAPSRTAAVDSRDPFQAALARALQAPVVQQAVRQAAANSASEWACDVCNEYKSYDYDEVARHEVTCRGGLTVS